MKHWKFGSKQLTCPELLTFFVLDFAFLIQNQIIQKQYYFIYTPVPFVLSILSLLSGDYVLIKFISHSTYSKAHL